MEDRQDGFREDAEQDNPKENDYDRTQNSQESDPTDIKGNEIQGKADARQETDPFAQEKAASEQKNSAGEEGTGMEKEPVVDPKNTADRQYSCQYAPPDYVPNFTIVEETDGKKAKRKKEKKEKREKNSFGAGAVALIVLICIVVSAVGAGVGYVGMRLLRNRVNDSNSPLVNAPIDLSEETVNVIKNDGSIKVNEAVGSTGYTNATVAEVVADVADSVVEITTSQVATDPFYGNYVTGGAGSGVIISENGVILTNNHVIEGATEIIVRLTDGNEYKAALVGQGDSDFDIAVLKIEATGLSAAVLGSSKSLIVGEQVVAIGNPLGELGGTVTDGIISALDRQVIVDGHRMTLLQTNAAINPGNSGGGLFNMAGELIGIVNAKQADTGIEGLGFAIPVDVAWSAAKDILEYGYVTGKLNLGFSIAYERSSFLVNRYQFPSGVYITGSTVEDLKAYDRIVSMNGTAINSLGDYYGVTDGLKEGDTLTLVIARVSSNGFTYSFVEHTVTLTVDVT